MYDLIGVVVHCGRWGRHAGRDIIISQCVLLSLSQWSQPRTLYHHSQEPWLLVAVWWWCCRGKPHSLELHNLVVIEVDMYALCFPCRRLSRTQLRVSLVRLMPSGLPPMSQDTSSSTSPGTVSSLGTTHPPTISTFYCSDLSLYIQICPSDEFLSLLT